MTKLSRSDTVSAIPGRLYWTAPYLAVVVFAVAMLSIVWLLQSHEKEVEANALARDVQWAERTMRVDFMADEEFFAQLAQELASDKLTEEIYRVRVTAYLANNPEVLDVVWIDAAGKVRWALNEDFADWFPHEELSPAQGQAARHARELGRAAYSQPYRGARGNSLMEVFTPVQRGRRSHGLVVAVYSIDGLLHHLVPNWFSDKYHLSLLDGTGEQLTSNVGPRNLDQSHSSLIVFDPPGNGLALRVTGFRADDALPRALPVALIMGLSVIVFWSLWLLRSHTLRRMQLERERDQLFKVSLDMLCSLSLEGHFRRLNPAFMRVLGYPLEELEGQALCALVHPEDQDAAREALQRIAAGAPGTFEARLRCRDGSHKWLVWNANPVLLDRVIYAVAHDITGRKSTEEAWRAESAFRKAMEESVRTGLRATDLNGRIIYVNPAFCEMVGYGPEALLGITAPFPYWPAEEEPAMRRTLELSLSGGTPPGGFEIRVRRSDGQFLTAHMMVSPLIDARGVQTGWMAAMSDITESKRIHAELEAAHERFVAVLDGLDTAVYVADVSSNEVLYANHACLAQFGADAVGRSSLSPQLPRPEADAYSVDPRQLSAESLPRELFDGELQLPATGRWYHLRERAARWVDGRIVRMAVASDITDRREVETLNRQQEERLQRTSRLITMGEMASTLAHELNQPLSAIANYSAGCVNRLQSGRYKTAELLTAMEKAAFQADRAGKIIRRIRDFVRKSEPRRAPASLASIVEDALGFIDIEARKYGARICKDIPADLPAVSADRIMIEQVLLNLVKNGIEAMRELPEAQRLLAISARRSGGLIEVAVRDKGPGIAAEDRDKLFNAFFTTKADGMGMGLNICRSIIEYHDGRLWVDNDPAGGATFRFTLPMQQVPEHDRKPA